MPNLNSAKLYQHGAPPIPGRPALPLPKKLFLQFDNSTKDNKNRYVMAFSSLLIARNLQGSNGGVPSSRPHSREHQCAL